LKGDCRGFILTMVYSYWGSASKSQTH